MNTTALRKDDFPHEAAISQRLGYLKTREIDITSAPATSDPVELLDRDDQLKGIVKEREWLAALMRQRRQEAAKARGDKTDSLVAERDAALAKYRELRPLLDEHAQALKAFAETHRQILEAYHVAHTRNTTIGRRDRSKCINGLHNTPEFEVTRPARELLVEILGRRLVG